MHPDAWVAAMRRDDFAAAWSIADAVLATRDPATRDDPAHPYHERWVWDGRPLTGQDVLVRCYHGLGDTLQFVRFLPRLRAQARRVTLEVQPELAELLQDAPGADEVVPFATAAPLKSSCDIEIMELPHALRARPDPAPYLRVPAGGGEGLVGVCWQAGGWDALRSVPLDQLRGALPARVISLQRGALGLPDPLHGTMDVMATARLVASLDHVITVDTMIAHLAGALGRPVSLLLRHHADWRWGEGEATPWYGATRMFRQRTPGDWSVPLAQLADQIDRNLGGRAR